MEVSGLSFWERVPLEDDDREGLKPNRCVPAKRAERDAAASGERYEKTLYDVEAERALDDVILGEAEFDEDGYWENHTPVMTEDHEEMSSVPRPRKKRGFLAKASVATLALLVGGGVVVAQPWVPAADDVYTEPLPERVEQPVTLRVGESYQIDVTCAENEEVASIHTQDGDIIALDGTVATALGQWDGAVVTITTKEKAVPQPQLKELKLLGMDLTKPYNGARTWLRDLLGIEKIEPPREELRVLNIYEMVVNVEGYTVEEVPAPINLYTDDQYRITPSRLMDGEEVVAECATNVVSVSAGEESFGQRVFLAQSTDAVGTDMVRLVIGFYKEDVFVPTRAIVYSVEVIERPSYNEDGELEGAVFASGSHNGLVPVDPPPQQDESDEGQA
jgi:hypothetical protein